ncbi:MAG: hypothetical protein EOO56_14920 [Hymenobacter sp.]|nr:MAG: hypothetical protein EOO56_14920 [Hymenobacter sp.]
MELDDLRGQWQRPEPAASPTFTSAEFRALMARQRGGLLEKMRRNTWYEAVVGLGLVAPVLIVPMFKSHKPLSMLYASIMCLLSLLMVYYYYRVLRVLRQLTETSGSVRNHLGRLYGGLRQLLRFYYRLTLAMSPVLLLLVYGFLIGKEVSRTVGFRTSLMVGIGIGLLFLGVVLQVAAVYGTRWWIQHLYGQHLDRLEGQLRELDEPAVPAVS